MYTNRFVAQAKYSLEELVEGKKKARESEKKETS